MSLLLQQTLAAVQHHGGLVNDHSIDRKIEITQGILVAQHVFDHTAGGYVERVTLAQTAITNHVMNVVEIGTHGIPHLTKQTVIVAQAPVFSVGDVQDLIGTAFIDAATFNI